MKLAVALATCLPWTEVSAYALSAKPGLVQRKYDFSNLAGVAWSGEILPGQNITLRGTMQDIRRSIQAINPEHLRNSNDTDTDTDSDAEQDAGLKKRWTERNHDCEYGEWAPRDTIMSGIRYLETKFNGNMQCGAGAGFIGHGSCSRVSCDQDAQIWLCNDNNFQLVMPCSVVGLVANRLWNLCYKIDGSETEVRGQMFTTGNWNVIIRKGKC